MKPQDVALWLGLASTVGGAAIGYGTLTEKVATLEADTNASLLESRLTKLEVRIEDNDIGRIGKEIETVRGQVTRLSDKVGAISVPSTDQIKEDIRVLQTEVDYLEERLEDVSVQLKEVGNKGKNPLG